MAKERVETSAGPVWVEDQQRTGDMRVWWPYGARVGEFAVEVLSGRARWDPSTKGWYVSPKHRDHVYEELTSI